MSSPPLRRNRDFVLLQAGQLLSNVGTQITQIAYPLLVLGLTHSAAKAGLVAFTRAKGVYGGVNLDGTLINLSDDWNERYYGKRVLPPVSKASGGLLPGIDITDSRSLQEGDDLDYMQRMTRPK